MSSAPALFWGPPAHTGGGIDSVEEVGEEKPNLGGPSLGGHPVELSVRERVAVVVMDAHLQRSPPFRGSWMQSHG